jgi:rod shape-determining protein MreC
MALSQSPPSLFRQGLSARLRLLIAVVASVALIQADISLTMLKPLRQGLSMVLYPVEQSLMIPRDIFYWATDRTSLMINLAARQAAIETQEIRHAEALLASTQLEQENANLRALMDLRKTFKHQSIAAEVSHYAKDAFSNRVVINRGSQHGIAPGHPVVNSQGVVGQVMRVSPITAEVSLITDPALTVPVNLPKSGVRSLLVGSGDGQQVKLRYLNSNVEVEIGDMVVTSGLDGLYPAGLPVAKISQIDRKGDALFTKVSCTPTATVGSLAHVLVILVDPSLIPPAPRDLAPSNQTPEVRK